MRLNPSRLLIWICNWNPPEAASIDATPIAHNTTGLGYEPLGSGTYVTDDAAVFSCLYWELTSDSEIFTR